MYNLLCLVLTVLLAMSSAEAAASGRCSLKGLPNGGYGLSLQGQLVNGPPYAAIGLLTLQKHAFELKLTASEGGVVTQKLVAGDVKVMDCGVTLSGRGAALGFVLKGQIARDGKEILITEFQAQQPIVASGVLQPIGSRSCSNRSLQGAFTYKSQGYERSPGGGLPWIPVGKVGQELFDGKGCTTYQESIKRGTVFFEEAGRLNYRVAKDCSFELLDGDQAAFYGLLVGGGQRMPYLKLVDGAVRLGEYQRVTAASRPDICR